MYFQLKISESEGGVYFFPPREMEIVFNFEKML